jgi:hypothetical protein
MNTHHKAQTNLTSNSSIYNRTLHQLRAGCVRCYEKVLQRLNTVKSGVEREFAQFTQGNELLLKAAINEAEAIAWQTPYPHLLFPVLAEEKAAAARQWTERQQAIRNRAPGWNYAT